MITRSSDTYNSRGNGKPFVFYVEDLLKPRITEIMFATGRVDDRKNHIIRSRSILEVYITSSKPQ